MTVHTKFQAGVIALLLGLANLMMTGCGAQKKHADVSLSVSADSVELAATSQNSVPETAFGHWWVDVRKLLGEGATGNHLQPSGLAIVDVDGDGREDLIVSNGYEQQSQPIIILRNISSPHDTADDGPPDFAPFDPKALMYSSRSQKFENICVGDLNGDGCTDLAASRFTLGTDKPVQAVFLNKPLATADPSGAHCSGYAEEPDFTLQPIKGSAVAAGGFGCAFGDVDGDGDLDLAVSVAYCDVWSCTQQNTVSADSFGILGVYLNDNGRLSSNPGWQPADDDELHHAGDILFADVNLDGLMDLVASAQGARVYFGQPTRTGSWPETRAGWVSPKPAGSGPDMTYSMGIDVAWLDDPETLGIAIAMNNNDDTNQQVGHDHIYQPCKNPLSQTCYQWVSESRGPGADIRLALLDDSHIDAVGVRYQVSPSNPSSIPATPPSASSTDSAAAPGAIGDSTCTTRVNNQNSSSHIYWDLQQSPARPPGVLAGYAQHNILGQAIELAKFGGRAGLHRFKATLEPGRQVITLRRPEGQAFITGIKSVKRANGNTLHFTYVPGDSWVSIPNSPAHTEPLDVEVIYEAYDYPDLVIADGCGFVHFFNNHMEPNGV